LKESDLVVRTILESIVLAPHKAAPETATRSGQRARIPARHSGHNRYVMSAIRAEFSARRCWGEVECNITA
jgi:hypothetical protein